MPTHSRWIGGIYHRTHLHHREPRHTGWRCSLVGENNQDRPGPRWLQSAQRKHLRCSCHFKYKFGLRCSNMYSFRLLIPQRLMGCPGIIKLHMAAAYILPRHPDSTGQRSYRPRHYSWFTGKLKPAILYRDKLGWQYGYVTYKWNKTETSGQNFCE